MRITKQLSEAVAKKLTETRLAKVDELLNSYRQLVTDEYKKQTPVEVQECYTKQPDWFRTTNDIRLNGHGFNWQYVRTTEPVITNSGGEAHIKLTEKIADRITRAKRAYDNANKQYKELVAKIEVALFNLRTYANVEKNLPEAIPFIPKDNALAVAINFSDIRKQIKAA